MTDALKLEIALQALRDVVDPLSMLRRKAKEEGKQIDGIMAVHWLKEPSTYQEIARDALTLIEGGEP